MIDCGVTENFLREFQRICESSQSCDVCPLHRNGLVCMDGLDLVCIVRTVQEWSDSHPPMTYLDYCKLVFSNIKYTDETRTLPLACRTHLFGGECEFGGNCRSCWNQIINGEAP